MNPDEQHLKLLRIFHYILGGIYLLSALFPIIHITMGASFMMNAPSDPRHGPPFEFGLMFVIVGSVAMLLMATLGVLQFFVARGLSHHKWWMLCMVVSGLNCMFMPMGTALGVFTIVVLLRPAVQFKFGRE